MERSGDTQPNGLAGQAPGPDDHTGDLGDPAVQPADRQIADAAAADINRPDGAGEPGERAWQPPAPAAPEQVWDAPSKPPAPAPSQPPASVEPGPERAETAYPGEPAERAAARPLPPVPPSGAIAPDGGPWDALRPPSRRSGASRSALTRLLAVAALAIVIAAVILLVRSLSGSGHARSRSAPAAVRVLIPEGKTSAQIAQIATAAGLTGSYRSAARRSPLLNPAHYGAPHGTPGLEGFLFPATYDVTPGTPVGRLVDEQLVAFKENFGSEELKRAHGLHVTPYQLLTIASMIEREAEVPGDRAKIAAVIYNRLHSAMPLGIDATIYYAVEQQTGIATYTRELSESQLHMDSPYNTRIRPGLPPTPISNPGLASIQAAAHPAHAPYLYYVAAADGCGEHVFSTSLAAFEANAAAYQAALRDNGGRLPACKKK